MYGRTGPARLRPTRRAARRHLARHRISEAPSRTHSPPLGAGFPTGWNVTAHLSLATAEVHLASWPAAPDDWPRLVHPTIHEVLGLCAALTVATAALDLSNRLAQV
ncbi:hypothetical protein NKH18_07110 [Streptomyces sp. M10(2022)]